MLGHPCVTARSAEDAALALQAIVAASTNGMILPDASGRPIQDHRIGVVTNFAADHVIRENFATVTAALESMQVSLVEIEAPFECASFDLSRVDHDRATINASLFGDVSAIVLPTLTAPTPTVMEARARGDMAVSPQNTFFANYFGLPAVSVPIGHGGDGRMPMGVQFVGPQGGDADVLALARAYQRAIGWRYAPPSSARAQMTAHAR
jgi:aspartyl-tRNA(Asn)/glutamyl-tRNA(Gln) amidotransferase subunit A